MDSVGADVAPSSPAALPVRAANRLDSLPRHQNLRDGQGRSYFVEPAEALALLPAETAARETAVWESYDLSQTFSLHSNSGALHTIFLDFDGHVTSGTAWNSNFNGGQDIVTPAWSLDADCSTFSDSERATIQRIWMRVAEDFAPFEVNVTTQQPPLDDLRKVESGDTRWGIRIVIGQNTFLSSAGGVAYLNSFNWNSDTPAFVFNTSEIAVAEAVSHEAGHTLGLYHDGTATQEYYSGHGSGATSWAPIMGSAYYRNVTQWSRGEYSGANNQEDDLAKIVTQNGFGYRADDYGDTFATASQLVSPGQSVIPATYGMIERNTDTDVFSFWADAAQAVLAIDPLAIGANLDLRADLHNAAGVLLATSNPATALNASLSLLLPAAGQYYVSVTGVGKGAPLVDGYSDYGSLGHYRITGSIGSSVAAMADLSLAISVSKATPNVGETVTLTIVASNAGPDDASGVAIRNVVPSGYSAIGNITAGGTLSGNAITWTDLSIPAAAGSNTVSLSFQATVTAPTGTPNQYVNVAEVIAADQPDPDSVPNDQAGDDYATVSVTPLDPVTPPTNDPIVIDNGRDVTGFVASGMTYVTTSGYEKDIHYTRGDNTGDYATWTFTGLCSGTYQVSTTWVRGTSRASNAPYTLTGVAGGPTTVRINQKLAPDDLTWDGVAWEHLGTFDAGGGTLTITLTDNADGYVYADAIRVELIGGGDGGGGDDGGGDGGGGDGGGGDDGGGGGTTAQADLSLTQTVSNPNPSVNELVTFTITVSNHGPDNASGVAIGSVVPSGLSNVANISGGGTLGGNAITWSQLEIPATAGANSLSLTFQAMVNAPTGAPGEYTTVAQVTAADQADPDSLPNDNTGDDYAVLTLIPNLPPVSGPQVIDNGRDVAGFIASGMTYVTTSGYEKDIHYTRGDNTGDYAQWTFTGLASGTYLISTTWVRGTSRASNAPYTLTGLADGPSTVLIDQKIAPNDLTWDGVAWEHLGTFQIIGGTLTVRLTDNANGYVYADAVRIEQLYSQASATEVPSRRPSSGAPQESSGREQVWSPAEDWLAMLVSEG
jgi:uncharacterized repeat protein (TIGR01451 family)